MKHFRKPRGGYYIALVGNCPARSVYHRLGSGEMDMVLQMLYARKKVIFMFRAKVLISQERAAHVVLVEQVGVRMAVVDRDHVTASETPADFADPVARFQPRFGV